MATANSEASKATPSWHSRFLNSSSNRVLALIFSLAAITYMDRLLISAAAPAISAEFGLSPTRMSYVFSAFSLLYALFEIPGGWLGDRFGARRAMVRIVLFWSAFTALTGATRGFASLITVRGLFGMGEAGAFPNIARAVANWFPPREQGRAMSTSFLGLALGSACTAPLVFFLMTHQGWRMVFVEFGVLGVLWTIAWWTWFQEHPGTHEAAKHEPVAWRSLLSRPNLWKICGMYFAYGYGLFFYITWLPSYLLKARGFSVQYTGLFSAMPWIFAAAGYATGGWITDRLWLAGRLRAARCGVGAVGYTMSGLLLIAVALTPNRMVAAALLAFAAFFQMMAAPAAWAVCLDVGQRRAGVVTGCMNTFGNIGGAIAPTAVGFSVQYLGSWNYGFYLTAAIFAFGVWMWLKVDPNQTVI